MTKSKYKYTAQDIYAFVERVQDEQMLGQAYDYIRKHAGKTFTESAKQKAYKMLEDLEEAFYEMHLEYNKQRMSIIDERGEM